MTLIGVFVLVMLMPALDTTVINDTVNSTKLQNQIEYLSSNIENLNFQYFNNLEQKINTILNTVLVLDTNIKALQEKAHLWEIFRHHIDAWNDHLKSVDHKIDLIKRTQDENQSIESKLNSLEFAVNHIITKLDQANDKSREQSPNLEHTINDIHKIISDREKNDVNEKREIFRRLSSIMKQIMNLEKANCNNNLKEEDKLGRLVGPRVSESQVTNNLLKDIQMKINDLVENLPNSDIMNQVLSESKKSGEFLEEIMEVVRNTDERTIRLYDSEVENTATLISSCKSNSDALSTFTESSDLLLKGVDNLLLEVQKNMDKLNTLPKIEENPLGDKVSVPTTEIVKNPDEKADDFEVDIITTPTTKRINDHNDQDIFGNSNESTSSEVPDLTDADFIQPFKSGCQDIIVRADGVYKFGRVPDVNEAQRDFNERYCAFATDGLAWTVIQKRGPYDIQENFNRSWADYKNGFGNLTKDFWFGNEFIHRLVYKDNFELRIELEDFDGVEVWAEYSTFQLDSEKYNYNLMIGDYRGAVSDSMLYHQNMDFSTFDRRNDKSIDECCPCAAGYGSGWWFDNCCEANLNGIYHTNPRGHNFVGIIWEHWHGDYSLKKARMLIRPKDPWSKENDDTIDDFPQFPEDP